MSKAQKKEDFIGKTYTYLTIIDMLIKNQNSHCKCQCKCGNTTTVILASLKNGHTTSCGCRAIELSTNTKRRIINDFSTLSPQSCYWAGFIFGDGCITRDHELKMCLGQGKETHNHLKKLSYFIFGKDYTNRYKDKCGFSVSSTNIRDGLLQYGIIPRKTHHGILILPKRYQSDFIRGYFDADGWFTTRKTYNKIYQKYYLSLVLGLCSFKRKNLDIINDVLPIKLNITKKSNQKLYEARCQSKKKFIPLIEYLQSNNETIYYEKKWNKIWKYLHSLKKN